MPVPLDLAVLSLAAWVTLLAEPASAQTRLENMQWRITNGEATESFWAVLEVEFHDSSACDSRAVGASISSGYVQFSDSGQHPPSYAQDGHTEIDLPAAWWSDCSSGASGAGSCAAGEAWIGIDFDLGAVDVRCVRLFQYPNVSHSTPVVQLQRWSGGSWVPVQTFYNVTTGHFVDLPQEPLAKWRLLAEAAPGGWGVAELALYNDISCSLLVTGSAGAYGQIGDGSAADINNPIGAAFDNDTSTSWAAPCDASDCAYQEAWVEFLLHVPGEVRCLRLLQRESRSVASVVLQSWAGGSFDFASNFTALTTSGWDHLARWEVCEHPAGSLMRLIPDEEEAPGTWQVAEVELHAAVSCSDALAVDNVLVSGASEPNTNVRAVMDGDTATEWLAARSVPEAGGGEDWSGWQDGISRDHHTLGHPWLGMALAASSLGASLRCIRFLQGADPASRAASSMVVQRWNGSAWASWQELFSGTVFSLWFSGMHNYLTQLGPLAWLRLPTLDQTMWRLSHVDQLWEHWAIKEISFYETIDCQGEVVGLPISAVENPTELTHPAEYAFDGELSTEWWSHCGTCSQQQAWLGIALTSPVSIRCVTVFQSSITPTGNTMPWWTTVATVEKWTGHHWEWVVTLDGLSRGAWERGFIYSHEPSVQAAPSGLDAWSTEENTLWRISHAERVARRWGVASIGFHTDPDCQNSADIASFMANGHLVDFQESHAFNQDLSDEWLSTCEACEEYQSWLGVRLVQPSWVRCVRLFQSVKSSSSGSTQVSLERFDGIEWSPVLLAEGLAVSAWELLRPPESMGGGGGSSRVRYRLVNVEPVAASWRVTSVKFFFDTGCVAEAVGFLIVSGHTLGHDVSAAEDSQADTFWESSCTGCGAYEAWVGISVDSGSPEMRCVHMRQVLDTAHGTTSVAVQAAALGSSWTEIDLFTGLNFGVWDILHLLAFPQLDGQPPPAPVPAGSLWRVVAASAVERRWVVRHLKFCSFSEVEGCSGQLSGTPIASGMVDYEQPPSQAFSDSDDADAWESPCIECLAGVAWVGLAFSIAEQVQCVELRQSELAMDSTRSVTLQRWDGDAWQTSRRFEGLAGGELLKLDASWESPAALQRYRIAVPLETSASVEQWKIAELGFYANVECTMQASGMAISSGFFSSFVPSLAFDGQEATAWESIAVGWIEEATDSVHWLGVHLPRATDIKCARILQGDARGEWSPNISFDRWDGGAWESIHQLNGLTSGGSWLAPNTFRSMWHGIFFNFQDAASTPPLGYIADVGNSYGPQGEDGMNFGWSCPLEGVSRGYFGDTLLDTLIEISCQDATWELDVLVGRYYVEIAFSNPGHGVRTSGCYVEGVAASAGEVGPYDSAIREISADVFDARLTLAGSQHSGCDSVAAMGVVSLPGPYTMWRVRNAEAVLDRWTIIEFELHASSSCVLNVFDVRSKVIIASGHALGSDGDQAVDSDESTHWASPCIGCDVGGAWLGATFDSLQLVECLKIMQATESERQAGSIALERWNATGWELEHLFEDTPGGIWGQFNSKWVHPPASHRWRLANELSVAQTWAVAEAEFFDDVGCSQSLVGFPLASDVLPTAPAASAFDGSLASAWVSPCGPCNASEEWIGVHYDSEAIVGCASAILTEDDSGQENRTDIALQLDEWNGSVWISTGASLAARPGARVFVHRFDLLGSQAAGALWRLVNAAATLSPWMVMDLEFHTQADCARPVAGLALASSEDPDYPAHKAFDGSTALLDGWRSGCADTGCPANGEWLGGLFAESHAFQCIRIYQASATLVGNPAASELRLERWDGLEWEPVQTFGSSTEPLISGRWLELLPPSVEEKFVTGATEWRIVADSEIELYWGVAEVGFYDNVECVQPILGTVTASSEVGNSFATAAIDGQTATFWYSEESPAPGTAWLGFVFGARQVIRCVHLLQSAEPEYSSVRAQIQSRPEDDWVHILTFDHVAAGHRQNLHVFEAVRDKPAGAMWRVQNFDDVGGGWIIAELEFYSDTECNRIEIGDPISSGQMLGFPQEAAFDVRLETWWRAQCSPCLRAAAWLGQSFYSLADAATGESAPKAAAVNCIVLFQGDLGQASDLPNTTVVTTAGVTVERWDGGAWQRWAKFLDLPRDEYVRLHLPPNGTGDAHYTIDAERKALMLASTSPPPDDGALRAELAQDHDLIQTVAKVLVDEWPLELTQDVQAVADFQASILTALEGAFAIRMDQPRTFVFDDSILLQTATPTSRAYADAGMSLYVALPIDNENTTEVYETDTLAVFAKFEEIVSEPYGVEALFLLDQFKTELRLATRLDPLQASVVAFIEPTMELHLVDPVLYLVAPPTTPPPSDGPAIAAPEEDNVTLQYIALLSFVVALVVATYIVCYCNAMRRELAVEREIWRITHPGGEPFILSSSRVCRKWTQRVRKCRRCLRCKCRCCRRSQRSQALAQQNSWRRVAEPDVPGPAGAGRGGSSNSQIMGQGDAPGDEQPPRIAPIVSMAPTREGAL